MAAAYPTCALPGCSKPPFPSPDPRRPHLTCGLTHHLLLMAFRFHPHLPHPPHQEVFHRNTLNLCALASCMEPPEPDGSWCSFSHQLQWRINFASGLNLDQFCLFPGCIRHVFVDENYLRSQFCGKRHEQDYAMQDALQRLRQKGGLQELQFSKLPPLESKCGKVPSVESRINSLKLYALHGVTPNDSIVDVDFFKKHPWDICKGGEICWLIVPLHTTRKSRRVTIEGFHWKQQGKPETKNSGYTLKYFGYKKLKGQENDAGCKYFLKEYTDETIKNFVLIELWKGDVRIRNCKGNKRNDKRSAQNIASWKYDDMDVDSSLWSLLSSPAHCHLDDIFGPNLSETGPQFQLQRPVGDTL